MYECLTDKYAFISKGERLYPEFVTENTIGFNVKREFFREVPIEYRPDQNGDTDEDI